jgi:hypothetical protein
MILLNNCSYRVMNNRNSHILLTLFYDTMCIQYYSSFPRDIQSYDHEISAFYISQSLKFCVQQNSVIIVYRLTDKLNLHFISYVYKIHLLSFSFHCQGLPISPFSGGIQTHFFVYF